MLKFKVGDKVKLIHGSDEMVICDVFGFRLVECEWVGKEGKIYRNSFRPDYLELSLGEAPKTSFEELVQKEKSQVI